MISTSRKKKSLVKQLSLTFTLTFVIILIIFAIIISLYNISYFKKNSYEYCKEIVNEKISTIDSYLIQVESLSSLIANERDILDAVEYRNSTSEIDYSIELYNIWNVDDKISKAKTLKYI